MSDGIDLYGRMNLPHSRGVHLRAERDRVTLTEHRRVRRWLFWHRWRDVELGHAECTITAGTLVTLNEVGMGGYVVKVDDGVVLRVPPPGRGHGFGMRAGA